MAKDIGIGIIGIGMGSTLLPINDDPRSRLQVRALCSQSEARVAALAAKWGLPFYTTDYREMLARRDIDVIGVYSPDHLHAEHAAAALEAGKHVICTKPMVTSVADAAHLVGLVDRTGLKFLVGQTMRFDPEFAGAKRMLDDGDLGEVIVAEGHYVHDLRSFAYLTPWRMRAPQDLMYGGASHPIDMLRWFLGDIGEVHCFSRRSGLSEYPLDEDFVINLRFDGGQIGRVLAAFGVVHPPVPMMGLGLYGTKGSLVADFTDRRGGSIKVVYDKIETLPTGTFAFPPETEGAHGHGETVLRYLRHFEECLLQDRQPSPGVRDGAKSVAVCAAAWESARGGQVVHPRQDF
ncbi:MAG: Gfo/Idh/MocA family protein [Anaerolineae bacterium]